MRKNRRVPRLLLLLALLNLPAYAQDFEIRGTVLCNEQGDPQRARPLRDQFLIAVPSLEPAQAVIVSPDGLFRFTLSKNDLDRLIHIRILRGREEVAVITDFLEPAKLRQGSSGKPFYVIPTHLLPWDCDSLSVPLEEAEAALVEVQGGKEFAGYGHKTSRRIPIAGIAGAIGSGAVAVVVGSASGGNLSGMLVPVAPRTTGELLYYSRQAFSPALGRSLLSWRDQEQAAAWNPSRLVFGASPFLSTDIGSQPMGEVTASIPLRATPAPDFGTPIDVLALSAWYRGGERLVEVHDTLSIESDREEMMITLAAAKMLAPSWSVSVSGRFYRQVELEFESEETYDMDVATTWMATDRVQAAIALHNALGSEVPWGDLHEVRSLRDLVGAILWTPPRFEVGLEVSGWEDRVDVTGGLSYRIRDWLAADLSGGTRYEAGALGLTFRKQEVSFRTRVRWDESEEWTGQLGLAWRAW